MILSLETIIATFLVFIRAGAFLLSVPLFSGMIVPRTVRVAIALLFAMLVAPIVPAVAQPTHYIDMFIVGGSEMLVGLLMGMAVRAVFATVDFAGYIIGMEIGLMRSTSLNPLSDFSSSGTVGVVLFYLAVLIFLVTEMHHQVLAAFVRSFSYVPIGATVISSNALSSLLEVTGRIFLLGMLMSAPFIAVNFLINTTFALMGRVSPKMNVFMISFAVRIMAGLAVLVSTATLVSHYIFQHFEAAPQSALNLLSR